MASKMSVLLPPIQIMDTKMLDGYTDTSRANSIVIGDVDGQLADVFAKLTKLHAKNSFAFAVIAGNLFADSNSITSEQTQELSRLVQGQMEVPLPTYFALGTRSLPDAVLEKLSAGDGELCPNLFVLGRKVSMKTTEGFKLVAIGGSYVAGSDEVMGEYVATYSDKDVESAREYKDADILITSEWPADVKAGSKVAMTIDAPPGVKGIGALCTALKPRYHFSTSPSAFEREPFFHRGPSPQSVTRFLSLAPLNNSQKQKAMYAFSLEPSAPPPQTLPDGCTGPPFIEMRNENGKRKLNPEESVGNSFRFATGANGGYQDYDRGYRHQKRRRQEKPAECFFCLGGNEVGAHMVTSIGENVYMTVAKGPLTTRDNFPGLTHPLHMLIIPVQHTPTFAAIGTEERESVKGEMQKYREALHSMVSVKSTKGSEGEAELGAVTWEISRGAGVHLHWQFLPVPANLIKRGLVEVGFDVEAENSKYPKFAKKARDISEAEDGDYFKVMIWCESIQKEMVLPLEKGARFDLQFGRRVLGKLLHLEQRTHWKDCIQEHAEEVADVEAFRELFGQYDPAQTEAE